MDRYTKAVLTVIAAALCALVAQNAAGPSQAQQSPVQLVAICSLDGNNCAGVVGEGTSFSPNRNGHLRVVPPR